MEQKNNKINWLDIYEASDVKTLKEELNKLLIARNNFHDNKEITEHINLRLVTLCTLIITKVEGQIN